MKSANFARTLFKEWHLHKVMRMFCVCNVVFAQNSQKETSLPGWLRKMAILLTVTYFEDFNLHKPMVIICVCGVGMKFSKRNFTPKLTKQNGHTADVLCVYVNKWERERERESLLETEGQKERERERERERESERERASERERERESERASEREREMASERDRERWRLIRRGDAIHVCTHAHTCMNTQTCRHVSKTHRMPYKLQVIFQVTGHFPQKSHKL